MKISIVTISYNQAQFLERAILSVINQNYKDLEYIVIDPGSTDCSRDIIEKYKSHFTSIILVPDAGAAEGLNNGFKYATGEIYGFLNSDDVLLPDALIAVSKYFQEHPTIDVISGHTKIIDSNDQFIRNSYSDKFSLVSYAYGACVLIQPSTFFKANCYQAVNGFNNSNFSNWDGELFVDIALIGAKFAVVNKFWSCFRLHPLSITSSKKLDGKYREYRKYIFQKIMKREPQFWDLTLAICFRISKYFFSPKSLYERIAYGSIYGYSAKSEIKNI